MKKCELFYVLNMSTFSGIVSEIPNISIDRFDGINLKSTAYFLSHCHSDHMRGLFDKFFLKRLQERNIYLYCSEISYYILMNTEIKNVKECLKTVSHQMEIIIKVPPSEHYNESQNITVTVVPAGHCPGSVMFLIDYVDGRILYTGDIRIVQGDIRKMKQFQDCDGFVKPIETLYLDTTFLHTSYSYFPCRKASASSLCELISEWITKSFNHYVHITPPAKHGSEFLFVEIFKYLKQQVHVNLEHFELYRNVPEVQPAITASAGLTQVHACWNVGEPCSFLTEKKKNGLVRVIKPSAMWFHNRQKEDRIWQERGNSRFSVAYSCHSSLSELTEIIEFLKPRNVIPCVIPPNSKYEDTMNILRIIQQSISDNCDTIEKNDKEEKSHSEFSRLLCKRSASDSDVNTSKIVKDELPSPSRKASRFI